jgi:hypothetical protein
MKNEPATFSFFTKILFFSYGLFSVLFVLQALKILHLPLTTVETIISFLSLGAITKLSLLFDELKVKLYFSVGREKLLKEEVEMMKKHYLNKQEECKVLKEALLKQV